MILIQVKNEEFSRRFSVDTKAIPFKSPVVKTGIMEIFQNNIPVEDAAAVKIIGFKIKKLKIDFEK